MNKIGCFLEVPDPITYKTKKLAMVLGRDMTGKMLASLYQKPFQSASEIAKLFNIHIATAQKYLMEMRECGLLESRLRRNSNRPTDEYWLAKNKVDIAIDLEQTPNLEELEVKAASIYIRQKQCEQVAYDSNHRNQIITEIILLDGKERNKIGQRIKLNDVEGKFTWCLPRPDEPPMSILDLVRKANLNLKDLPLVLELVDKLATIELDSNVGLIGIIERTGGIE
jgi:transposase